MRNLRTLRSKAGYSQESLAAAVGVSHGYISRLENGMRGSIDAAFQIADVLGTDVETLCRAEKYCAWCLMPSTAVRREGVDPCPECLPDVQAVA